MRRVQGHLPGKDRHPANPASSPLERVHRQTSAEVAARDRAGAAWCTALCEDCALSADNPSAWKICRDAPEAVRAQGLSAPDARAVRQLDEVSRLPAAAPA